MLTTVHREQNSALYSAVNDLELVKITLNKLDKVVLITTCYTMYENEVSLPLLTKKITASSSDSGMAVPNKKQGCEGE